MDASGLARAPEILRSSISAIESLSSSLESWLYFWVSLVVLGVAIEIAVVVLDYREELEDFHRGTIRSPEKPRRLKFGVEFFAATLVVIGVAGELAIDVRAGTLQTKLRSKNEELIQLLEGAAGKALSDAVEVGINLELEKQKTARFEKEAGEARLALETRVTGQGPRYLLLRGAASKLAKELSRFHEQRAALLVCGIYKSERETLETWGSLANILGPDTINGVKGAGWKMVRGNPIWDKCFLSMQGVAVMVSSDSPKTTRDAAEALSRLIDSVVPPYNKNPTILDPAWIRQKMAGGISLDKDDPQRLAVENPDMIVVFVGEHPPQ